MKIPHAGDHDLRQGGLEKIHGDDAVGDTVTGDGHADFWITFLAAFGLQRRLASAISPKLTFVPVYLERMGKTKRSLKVLVRLRRHTFQR